jgi:hypothetical protein
VSDSSSRTGDEAYWRFVDGRLAAGELDADGAVAELFALGLVRKANGLVLRRGRGQVRILEPARDRLVPGPRLLLDLGRLYGGTRLYRPVRDVLLVDTGAFSGPVPAPEDPREELG